MIPESIVIYCPKCDTLHVDSGEWETKPHKIHLCANCNHEWQPSSRPTFGVDIKEAGDIETRFTMPKGFSAVIINPEGEVVESLIGQQDEDEVATRGTLAAAALIALPQDAMDALINKFLKPITD